MLNSENQLFLIDAVIKALISANFVFSSRKNEITERHFEVAVDNLKAISKFQSQENYLHLCKAGINGYIRLYRKEESMPSLTEKIFNYFVSQPEKTIEKLQLIYAAK